MQVEMKSVSQNSLLRVVGRVQLLLEEQQNCLNKKPTIFEVQYYLNLL